MSRARLQSHTLFLCRYSRYTQYTLLETVHFQHKLYLRPPTSITQDTKTVCKRGLFSCTRSSHTARAGPSSPMQCQGPIHTWILDFRTCESLADIDTSLAAVTSPVRTSKSTEAEILVNYKQKKKVANASYIEQ